MKIKSIAVPVTLFVAVTVLLTLTPFVVLNGYFGYGQVGEYLGKRPHVYAAVPVVCSLLIILCTLGFVRYLRGKLSRVSAFADAVAAGDLSKRLNVAAPNEFTVMEERLNAMVASVEEMNKRALEGLNAAEFANRSKSEFLSRMSHEIRSPMNAIIGMTQIARASSANPEKVQDCLTKINGASKHLLALINDVLDMSKIEANKFELSNTEFSLDTALNKIYDMMNVKAEEKGQTLSLTIDKKLPEYVVSDELRFSQVIANLVSNAVKFTDEGGKIDIYVRIAGGNGNECVIGVEVKDTGIGLTEEQSAKLFKPFEQADITILRKFGGTGLGLAINKRIVEMMGGTISVSSVPGKGSTFSFTAKMRKGTGDIVGAKREREQLLRSVQAKNVRVLVVDDSAESREYISYVLTTLGFECEHACDGEEAVAKSEKTRLGGHPYDIIFMDYMMPKLDGIEAARKIKETTGENVSIVMVSMYDWKEFEQKAREAGIVKCVTKPISPSSVLDSISEIMPTCVIKNSGNNTVTPPTVSFSGNTILLVEDIDINREIITAFLEETHVSIDVAVNGVEAVGKFGENPDKYDIVLMDIQMPEMDGFEATRRIRAMGTTKAKSIPIVAMTANALSEDVQRCKEAGMNDHIAKPVDQEALMFKLNDFFFMKEYLGKEIH
ncbi:MAG: response regulator [Chitinispirillales bacterium]|jgi:signal transduction histidine kinase/CheY-like chemotaxis protein|nr:response regulator [Chitinispirillales bacterium]